jgi:hypothetical protein
MNALAIAKIIPLLNALLAIDDACGCCDQQCGLKCCEAYEQVTDAIDEACDGDDEAYQKAFDAIFKDIPKWIATWTAVIDVSDSEDEDDEASQCPNCYERDSECEEAGGYMPQCRMRQ